jgi:hypothetical protein
MIRLQRRFYLMCTGLGALLAVVTTAPAHAEGFITRSGSTLMLNGKPFRFAGANCYWLGLDENVGGIAYPTQFRVDDALETAENMGATVVRAHTLGVSVGNALSVEPTLNTFNANAFKVIDYAIASAARHGIRLIIPLVDNYHYYHGGKHTFTDWRGISDENQFYTNTQVISDFENYVKKLLTHVNSYTGVVYMNDPTIMAWETGNEISPPVSWTQTIAQFLKSVDKHHLVLDGTYGINTAALQVDAVDIVSDHFYPLDANKLSTDAQTAQKGGKAFVAGEIGWSDSESDLSQFLATAQQTTALSGDLYWSLFPHLDTYGFVQHGDGFTIHYPGDDSNMASAAQALRGHAYAMSGISTPPTDLKPLAPLVASVSEFGDVAWRGSANSAAYRVQCAHHSSSGPWTTLTDLTVTDNQTPWLDTSNAKGGTVWYRVLGENVEKQAGPYSPPYQATLDASLTDLLANLNLVTSHTTNWSIDTSNPQYLGGSTHRATRSVDDLEKLYYSRPKLKSFLLQIYSKTSASTLAGILNLYVSVNGSGNYTAVPWTITHTWDGGNGGGWTGYEIRPSSALPSGATGLLITVGSGSGYNWDPQIARVSVGASP